MMVFISCSNNKTQIISSENFKTDKIVFPLTTYEMLWDEMYKDSILYVSRNDKILLLCYDIGENTIDTIVKDDYIADIEILNDSTIFYTNYLFGNYQIKSTDNKLYDYFANVYHTVSHPYWNQDYKCISVAGSGSLITIEENSGIIQCVKYYIFGEDYSEVLENNIPVYLRFEIAADSSIIPVSFFGEYPKNHPEDNYADCGRLGVFYNHKSKNIITYTAVDDYVVLCDSMGNKIQDVYFGSQLYKYSPFSIDKKNKMAESINHYYNATLYSYIGFDEYRNIYYRWMSLPRERDENSMIKEDVVDYILIVADEKFNIKYEVFFDGDKYHPIPANDLINEKGLLIYEKENKEWKGSHTAAWFVFK